MEVDEHENMSILLVTHDVIIDFDGFRVYKVYSGAFGFAFGFTFWVYLLGLRLGLRLGLPFGFTFGFTFWVFTIFMPLNAHNM